MPSSTPQILTLTTLETKARASAYFHQQLEQLGLSWRGLDTSLRCSEQLSGANKLAAMQQRSLEVGAQAAAAVAAGAQVVVGLGGGTGGQIALDVLRQLPVELPKVLISSLAFDLRDHLAANFIVVVPCLCDFSGRNHLLDQALERGARVTQALSASTSNSQPVAPSVGISELGVTSPGVQALRQALQEQGHQSTIFHANGYGGAALAYCADQGHLSALVDYTPHEITRILIAGAHAPMPRRFSAAIEQRLPIVICPGGLNFLGLGTLDSLSPEHRARPHYQHSPSFTHVAISIDEMRLCVRALLEYLRPSLRPITLLVPMGGFSSEDRPGGALENPDLRSALLECAQAAKLRNLRIIPHPNLHINHPTFAQACSQALLELLD